MIRRHKFIEDKHIFLMSKLQHICRSECGSKPMCNDIACLARSNNITLREKQKRWFYQIGTRDNDMNCLLGQVLKELTDQRKGKFLTENQRYVGRNIRKAKQKEYLNLLCWLHDIS
jgi:hypothetical protein